MTQWDALVVGAGPAGVAAALSLTDAGLRVLVVERAKFPRDKICGDGLSPACVEMLERLGVRDVLVGAMPVRELTVAADGVKVTGELPTLKGREALGYVVPRLVLDARLRETLDTQNVEVWEDCALHDAVWEDGEGWRVVVKQHGQTRELCAKMLVGADGVSSKVRRLMGADMPPPTEMAAGVRAYGNHTVGGKPAGLRFDFDAQFAPYYGWVFCDGGGRVNVGVMCVAHDKSRSASAVLRTALTDYAARQGVKLETKTVASWPIPLAHGRWEMVDVHRNVALVGDAAALVNPATGEGIFYALMSGWELGQAVKNHGMGGKAMQAYVRALQRRWARHYWHNRVIVWGLGKAKVAPRVVALCARNKRVYAQLTEVMLGERTWLAPDVLVRLGWCWLR